MFKATKRFIAGAVCPKCSQMDKLVMYKNSEGVETRECVSCGYIDTMKEETQQPAELTTRISPTGKVILDEGEQAIRIFESPNVKH